METSRGLDLFRSVQEGIYRSITINNAYNMMGPDIGLKRILPNALLDFVRPERPVDCWRLAQALSRIAGEMLPGIMQYPLEISPKPLPMIFGKRLIPRRYLGDISFERHYTLALEINGAKMVCDPNLLEIPIPFEHYLLTAFIGSNHLHMKDTNLS